MVRDAVLTAVDVAHAAGHDQTPLRTLPLDRIGGDSARAEEVTVEAVLVAAELLAALAEQHGVERGRVAGWFDGTGW